tara:strand:- start:783 stop:1103 length:321 start_codon:yes stop_codon:yes gene_type:complete
MSERDLVRELKENIKELTQDRDDALAKCKTKESRMRQIMIKLEHATNDVQSMGHKIGEQNKKMAELEAKLETKEKLLEEALNKIKGIYEDSTQETDTDTEDQELDQ